MTGQDAVNTAKEFNDRLDFDGVVLTKLMEHPRWSGFLFVVWWTSPLNLWELGKKWMRLDLSTPVVWPTGSWAWVTLFQLVERAQEQFDEEEARKLQKENCQTN